MKIGFVSRYDPTDKKTWSGISYYTLQQLKRYADVELFYFPLPKLLQEWLTTQKSINRRWFKKNTSVEFLTGYARYFSRQLTIALKKRPVDILFVSASPQLIAFTDTAIPIIYHTDATFQQLQGYYPYFSDLAAHNITQGIALDKLAFQKANHCILSSDWNRRSAVQDYGINPAKLSVVPLGANMPPVSAAEAPLWPGTCRLLFLGVEWERKGGDIALAAFYALRAKGLDPHLHIIGCVPPVLLSQEKNITVIPFLDKNDAMSAKQLQEIFSHTDLLLLPTRAECAGVVFCEAAAYGIPAITTDTGGVSDYVKHGVTGYTLPADSKGQDYAAVIETLLRDQPLLAVMKQNSRHLYETTLNWDYWGNAFHKIISHL